MWGLLLVALAKATVAHAASGIGIDERYRNEPILPLNPATKLDSRKVKLGDLLFHDTRLSHDNTVSCASCHNLATAGVDRLPQSLGIRSTPGAVNAPTVYNSGLSIAQFWDGRADSLEEQAAGPVHNPKEMDSNWDEVVAKLGQDGRLVQMFAALYEDGLVPANIQDAIATFERSLTTARSPFDRYLSGDDRAISEEARKGYLAFKSYGCSSCHQGANVGGNMFQKLGAMGDYFADRGGVDQADFGRFNVTGDELDRHVFKVPSLRLATLTPPYFHDGTVATIEEAIRLMARYQLGRNISDEDVALIVAFLGSLVGEHERLER